MIPAKTYTREQIEKAWPASYEYLCALFNTLDQPTPAEPEFVTEYVKLHDDFQFLDKSERVAKLILDLVESKVNKLEQRMRDELAKKVTRSIKDY
jgi:hypothetical protein